jgi:hypothetical protein
VGAQEGPLLRLEPEDYSRTRDHQEFGGGYTLRHSREDFGVAWRFLDPQKHGACVVRVAGTEARSVELQLAAFAPGEPVRLRPEPDSPDGPDVIAVWDTADTVRLGHIARQNLIDARALLFGGEPIQAIVLWDWRTEDGIRKGLNVLIARAGVVKDLGAPTQRLERPPSRRTAGAWPAIAAAVVAWIVLASLFGLVGAVGGGIAVLLVVLAATRAP